MTAGEEKKEERRKHKDTEKQRALSVCIYAWLCILGLGIVTDFPIWLWFKYKYINMYKLPFKILSSVRFFIQQGLS